MKYQQHRIADVAVGRIPHPLGLEEVFIIPWRHVYLHVQLLYGVQGDILPTTEITSLNVLCTLRWCRYNELADIWSFGITILEMAHGHAPFARFPPMKVLLMTIQNPPPQLDSDKKHFSKVSTVCISSMCNCMCIAIS